MDADARARTAAETAPTPPSNVEAEAALLGALMSHDMGWLIDYTADRLAPVAFAEPFHGDLYELIQQQHALGRSTSPVALKIHFENDRRLDDLGGPVYLSRLTADPVGLFAGKDLTDQILELAQRRKIMDALAEASERCTDHDIDVAAIVSELDAILDEPGFDQVVESDAADCFAAFVHELDADHSGVSNHRIEGLDDLLGALEPKSLTILAARPDMGKTAVASNYALGAARAGHGVCFASLEMSREQLMGRMLSDASFDDSDRRVPYTAIQKRSLHPWQRDRVNDLGKWIGSLPLTIIDAGTLQMGRLDRLVRRQKRRFAARGVKLELLVIDYLQLLHTDKPKRSPYETVSEISMRLKAMAKDHGIAILALAQLSRVVETRQDKRPILSDLRDSGQIEQDADAVLFLLRQEYYDAQGEPHDDPEKHAAWEAKLERNRGVIEFILAKRRNGTTGTARGRFYGPYQAVR